MTQLRHNGPLAPYFAWTRGEYEQIVANRTPAPSPIGDTRTASVTRRDIATFLDALRPPDWHRLAACRGVDTNLFFSENPEPAKAWCARCPVVAECRASAVRTESVGVFGGMTAHERRVAEIAHPRPCVVCGEAFNPKRASTRYCSRKCGRKTWYRAA